LFYRKRYTIVARSRCCTGWVSVNNEGYNI
jgi:hypothetical protein